MKQPRRATVWWGDAHHSIDLFDVEDLRKRHRPFLVASTGWVIISDKVGMTMVNDWKSLPENDWVGAHYDTRTPDFIPRGMIQRVEWLEVKA